MPRKKRATLKREIIADPKYQDVLVAKLINKITIDGKKAIAEKNVYGAFDIMSEKLKDDPVKLYKAALEKLKPLVEVRSRRIGGANYQVPVEVRTDRRISLGIRWLVDAARNRGEKTFFTRLASELMEALEDRGTAIKKKEDMHRMAEANKAFAHFRW